MARGQGLSGTAVAAVGAGAMLLWSGLKGASVTATLQDLIRGTKPSGDKTNPIDSTATSPQGAGGGTTTASTHTIVATAMEHKGRHPYVYGAGHGAWSNARGSTCAAGTPQDCSGFASCVLHELGLLSSPLNTTGFLAWSGARTVPWEQRAAGDLIIWPQHMGIAVSPTQMIHTGGARGCPCVVSYSRTRRGRVGVARRVK